MSEKRKGYLPLLSLCFMSELQLLADQNLKLIDPFYRIAAKTKE